MFGGTIAKGLEQFGQGATTAGKFFGQVAADDASNSYQDAVNKILHGDPNKTTIGPDGQPQQDLGYLGLKGRAALDARPGVEQQLDELAKSTKNGLTTLEMQMQFENFSRRYRSMVSGKIGEWADNQANTWYNEVNQSSANLAKEHIATNYGSDDEFLHGLEDLKSAYAKQADLAGGGDQLKQAAIERATREAYATRVQSVGATDPAAALKMADANKDKLGANWAEIHERLQTRADQQIGNNAGDAAWKQSGRPQGSPAELVGKPSPAGGPWAKAADGTVIATNHQGEGVAGVKPPAAAAPANAAPADDASMVRHFEGFRTNAYWDVNHWRTGYGSDTKTNADGSVEPVTATTTVTKEDAERDLARRVQQSQGQIKESIGQEAWDKLSPKSRASMTSVTYNYGHLPGELAAAAKSGDDNQIAAAIAALPSNPGRRQQEASYITGGFTPSGPAQVQGGGAPTMTMPRAAGGAGFDMPDQSPVAISLADKRASAFGQIMDNPDLTFEQRRHALAYVEQQYTARTTEGSVEKQTLEQTVPNLIAAVENGVENVTIPFDRINAVMPGPKAKLWQDEFEMAQQTGTAIKALKWSSPEDVAAMQRDIESGQGALSEAMKAHKRAPTTGPGVVGADPDATENDAMRFRLRQGMARQFDAALNRRQAMITGADADPAQYVAAHPIAKAATAALDNNNPATFAAYAQATLGLQQHIGASDPQILTKAQAERLAARWANPEASGGATAVAADIQKEAIKWGDYWPQVYRQVAPKANELIRVIGAGTNGTAAKELLEAQGIKDEDLLKGEDDPATKRTDINKAVSDALKPFATTIASSQKSQLLTDYQKIGERLAILRLDKNPGDAAAAAKSAVDDLLNFKYTYNDTYRVPKDASIDPKIIQAGVVEAREQLGNPETLNIPGGSPDTGPLMVASKQDLTGRGVDADYLGKESVEGLRTQGRWLTDPSEKGLVLMQGDGFAARRPDGTPLMLTWGQLSTLGHNYGAARRAQEYRDQTEQPYAGVGMP